MSRTGQISILAAAFLGWFFAGVQLGVNMLVMRTACKTLLGSGTEADYGQWFGWLTSSFLLGGAVGGYLFGWLGDRWGRRTAMALTITCYSLFAAAAYFSQTPGQLLVLRFATGLGVGGMWPNGVALIAEAWPGVSRPILAGVIGTAANLGIAAISALTCVVYVTPEHWRWTMAIGLIPLFLVAFIVALVPESPKWLALRTESKSNSEHLPDEMSPLVQVFRPPLLRMTLIGIVLGTIPLFGGWGSANWATAWADQVGERNREDVSVLVPTTLRRDPAMKSRVTLARSATGSIASLLGGVLAAVVGRRLSYFALSFICLGCAQYMFWFSHPDAPDFIWWTAALGLFSGFYFGWLPLCLPELFPTAVRSTGAGVSFNFGRIATVVGILIASGLLKQYFDGDYAQIGRLTSWIFAVGMLAALFIPPATASDLD